MNSRAYTVTLSELKFKCRICRSSCRLAYGTIWCITYLIRNQTDERTKTKTETAGQSGLTMTLLRIPTSVSAAANRPASYGNQTICSTRPSCWIQISTVDVINIAADHQMFMTLTGELSWQRLRRSAVDFYSKNEKNPFWATLSGLRGNVRTPSIARWKARDRLYIRHNWTFLLSLTVETL